MNFPENENNIKELMTIFQLESEEIIERIFEGLSKLEKKPYDKELTAALYRDFHSIKGAIRMVGFTNIQMIIHKIEDVFDELNTKGFGLSLDDVILITKAIEIVSNYIQESVKNQREIIGEDFTLILEKIEQINAKPNENSEKQSIIIDTKTSEELQLLQENVNYNFNACFEIIDSIVPEQETQEIVVLKENVSQIYELLKDIDLYEVKNSLQNVLAKLDFVMNATNTFTISEILEMRNELSSAAAKYNTSCIDTSSSGVTFFDLAEKVLMLQSSSVYAKEIKEDLVILKKQVDDSNIVEIVDIILENLDFIIENSVQLEEQMAQTLKSGIEYCASPNESIDGDLIIQQLEIMKQL